MRTSSTTSRHPLVLALALTLLWPLSATSQNGGATPPAEPASATASAEVNTQCPLEPSEPASAEYELTYRGKKVRFCCSGCMEEFQTNPRAFLAGLPQFGPGAAEAHDPAEVEAEHEAPVAPTWFDVTFERYGLVLSVLLACCSLYALSSRLSETSTLGRFRQRVGRWRATLGVLLGLVLGALAMDVIARDRVDPRLADALAKLRDDEAEDQIHFATFHDYGYPPVPFKPPQPPALKRTYYRGNDERNPKLFNAGLYRTTTFELQLVDARGAPVEYGSTVSMGDLFIRIETIRGKNTPNYFWTKARMNRIFLTTRRHKFLGRDGPVEDAVPMTTLEPMQRWEQLYPLGNFQMPSQVREGEPLGGIIYMCETLRYEDGSVKGARMHFAIQFSLAWQDGKLAPSSELWMGSLYRTRKLPIWKIAAFEWFSHEPLPELPFPHRVQDPEVLGISDHQREDHEQAPAANAAAGR